MHYALLNKDEFSVVAVTLCIELILTSIHIHFLINYLINELILINVLVPTL